MQTRPFSHENCLWAVALLLITKNSKNVTLCMHDKNANKNWNDGKKNSWSQKQLCAFFLRRFLNLKQKRLVRICTFYKYHQWFYWDNNLNSFNCSEVKSFRDKSRRLKECPVFVFPVWIYTYLTTTQNIIVFIFC
jgi:hypothetical protein